MLSDEAILITQKATVYDLLRILEQDPEKDYTVDELKKIFDAYIAGSEK